MAFKEVRVRFAPSPTGPLHIGGLRTALFNYLFAKKNNGTFILRIEDTDLVRLVPGAEDYIVNSLRWAGIMPDEGIPAGGPHSPYRQSERKDIYRQYAERLITSGNAYYAFDMPETVDKIRKDYESRKMTFTYDAGIRGNMDTSINLTEAECNKRINDGAPYVIRYKFEPGRNIVMNDIIRGEVTVNTSTLDDKVLFKSDGMPTYHLANVVDDHLMKISHVIRGEEWLPSLPLHVSLYKSFGWEDTMPEFAHLPLILKPDGKGKLSKRDGDKGGFPVFPIQWKDPASGEVSRGYRESGYFPDACLNILAFLGWNPGTEKEIYSLDELVQIFSLEKVGKSGSKFDPEKARWFNHHYLQLKTTNELADLIRPVLVMKDSYDINVSLEKIIELVRERLFFVHDFWDEADFFFTRPCGYDPDAVKKYWKPGTSSEMKGIIQILADCESFEADMIEKKVKDHILTKNLGMGQIMNAWRIALVGTSKGPGIAEIAAILGRDEVIHRIIRAIEIIAEQ